MQVSGTWNALNKINWNNMHRELEWIIFSVEFGFRYTVKCYFKFYLEFL